MKLHLGCGKRYFPGWVHVDIDAHEHVDVITPIEDLSCFDDRSADLIYSAHALEYFDRQEAYTVLKEWRRVLKLGGILRVAVPNIDALLKIYNTTENLSDILGPLYGRMNIKYNGRSSFIYHKTAYNFKDLSMLLQEVGFNHIQQYDWRLTEHANYDDHSQAYFPHMDKEHGMLVSLNIEAVKC